jgi:hypothetical protein
MGGGFDEIVAELVSLALAIKGIPVLPSSYFNLLSLLC